jgi:peptidylprolyl isomerase
MKKAMPPQMDPIPYVQWIVETYFCTSVVAFLPCLFFYRTLPEITHRVYFQISIDGDTPQKVVFGLFGTIAPKTVENFVALSTCSIQETGKLTGKPLCYKNTVFHRIIPHFALQGGDFSHGDGTGGESIYGGRFADESFEVKFNRPYLLAMSNAGRNSNGSQFFITVVKAQWLDQKHVIFGTVLEGRAFIDELEGWGTYGGMTQGNIEIVECGEEPLKPEDKEPHYG